VDTFHNLTEARTKKRTNGETDGRMDGQDPNCGHQDGQIINTKH